MACGAEARAESSAISESERSNESSAEAAGREVEGFKLADEMLSVEDDGESESEGGVTGVAVMGVSSIFAEAGWVGIDVAWAMMMGGRQRARAGERADLERPPFELTLPICPDATGQLVSSPSSISLSAHSS